MKKVTIIAKPAQQYMVSKYAFLNCDILVGVKWSGIKRAMRYQIEYGHALLIEAHVIDDNKHVILPLAIAGLINSDADPNVAEIWFEPTVDMPQYAKSLLCALPRLIKGLMLVGGYHTGLALIDASNDRFKKFAKLCKFDYSSNLEIRHIKFEEWKFGGYR